MRENEDTQQLLLLLIDAALRAGHSEQEIAQIVDEAFEADAELDAAA